MRTSSMKLAALRRTCMPPPPPRDTPPSIGHGGTRGRFSSRFSSITTTHYFTAHDALRATSRLGMLAKTVKRNDANKGACVDPLTTFVAGWWLVIAIMYCQGREERAHGRASRDQMKPSVGFKGAKSCVQSRLAKCSWFRLLFHARAPSAPLLATLRSGATRMNTVRCISTCLLAGRRSHPSIACPFAELPRRTSEAAATRITRAGRRRRAAS